MAPSQLSRANNTPHDEGASGRVAAGDVRPHPPERQPRQVPMGARTEALHRAQKRRRADARRATFITRSIWVLAHLLILAAILSSPSQIHRAMLTGDPLPILLGLVLIALNSWLYSWVSVSNPGVVTAESNAKRAERASQQAAANTASTTAAQLARNNNRPDTLSTPAATGASTLSSMGASSAVSGTMAAKGSGCATPCVTSASPSTQNTPTTWHTARMSTADASPAPSTSPTRRTSTSPGPAAVGYGRVPVTDDADDEQFHDGFPSAAAGLVATACGSGAHPRFNTKSINPVSIPPLSQGPPSTLLKAPVSDALPWPMSELGSVMSGGGDTSRTTGTTHGTGDLGGSTSAALVDSPAVRSTGHHTPPGSPSATGPRLSPPNLRRVTAAEATASHFGFRSTLPLRPQRHTPHALYATPNVSPSPSNSSSMSVTNPAAPAPLHKQFRSASSGAAMPPGPVAESRMPRTSRERIKCSRVCSSCQSQEACERVKGVPGAVAEARSSRMTHVHSQMPIVSSGGASSATPAATLVETTSSLRAPRELSAHVVSTSVPDRYSGEYGTVLRPQRGAGATHVTLVLNSPNSMHSYPCASDASSVTDAGSADVSPSAACGHSPAAVFPHSSVNVSLTVSGHGDLHSSSSAIHGNGCINVRGSGPIAKSANSAARVLHRSMHSVGRWLTMIAHFRFSSDAYDDEDALLELDELDEVHGLHVLVHQSSAEVAKKPSHERKLSGCACFTCVRPACVEEDVSEAGPVAEGRFMRGQERSRARGGAAKQQGQEGALDVLGTPLVNFGTKNSDMMGNLAGFEMLSYEPSQATELNPFVHYHEMGAPGGSMVHAEPFASPPMATPGSGFSTPVEAGLGGIMPLAVSVDDPLAATIDVSEDPLCSQPNPDAGTAASSGTPRGSRLAARAVASVFRSNSKARHSTDAAGYPNADSVHSNTAGTAVGASAECSSPSKAVKQSPTASRSAVGVTRAACTSRMVALSVPMPLESTVETVVVPEEGPTSDTSGHEAHNTRTKASSQRSVNEQVLIVAENPLHSTSPSRRMQQAAATGISSTTAIPQPISPFEQRPCPPETPPPRSAPPSGLGSIACGMPRQQDVGPPLQGINMRRHMCTVPDPRASYRSHLRGSLGLSNMSLGGATGTGTTTTAPDWYSPTNPGRDCPYCVLWQPLRAKHCHDCGHCVRRFDHHCAWIGNCVGERNHRLFFSYLSAQFALLVWAAYQLVSAFGTASRWNVWVLHQLHLLLAMLVLILFSIFVASLWLYHMYLAFTNQTTYEASFRDRVPYLKDLPEHTLPFSHSISSNLHQFCFPDPNGVYTIKLSRSW